MATATMAAGRSKNRRARTLDVARAERDEFARALDGTRGELEDTRRSALAGDALARAALRELSQTVEGLTEELAILDQEIRERVKVEAQQQQAGRVAAAQATEEACRRRVVLTQAKLEERWAALLVAARDQVAEFKDWDQARIALEQTRGRGGGFTPPEEMQIRTRSLGMPNDLESMRVWRDRFAELVLRELVGGWARHWRPGGRRDGGG